VCRLLTQLSHPLLWIVSQSAPQTFGNSVIFPKPYWQFRNSTPHPMQNNGILVVYYAHFQISMPRPHLCQSVSCIIQHKKRRPSMAASPSSVRVIQQYKVNTINTSSRWSYQAYILLSISYIYRSRILSHEKIWVVEMEESLPPGFRFHPTDEELITYYLTRKVTDVGFQTKAMAVVDLNKCEPWDLPGS